MATKLHSALTDADGIHEPKGISTANAGEVPVCVVAGAATQFKKIDKDSMTSGPEPEGQKLISDGSGEFVYRRDTAHGSMVITNNTVVFPVTAAADSTFNTTSDFVLLTGPGAPWAPENLYGMTHSVDRLTVPVKGVYEVRSWMHIDGFPTNTARVAVRYRVNGSTFSARAPIVKSNSNGDHGTLVGFGLVQLNANDFIQVYVASGATGNLRIRDANAMITLVREIP